MDSRGRSLDSDHASWKGKSAHDHVNGSRNFTLGVSIFTLLALFCLLVWLLRWPDRLETHILTMTNDRVDMLTVPPLLFASDDEQALGSIGSLIPKRLTEINAKPKIGQLEQELAIVSEQDSDVVVLFVSAQSVSEDGVAYLLYRDFDPASPAAGRYPIAALLDPLMKCRAGIKLLILDCGNMISDARLGLLLNEFPRLLAQQVAAATPDSTVWVLASHSVGQTASNVLSARRSVFGRSVCEGLAGAADHEAFGKPDRMVTLRELYRYVATECRRFTAGQQTPMLMQAGVPLKEVDERAAQQIKLCRVLADDAATPSPTPPDDERTAASESLAEPADASSDEEMPSPPAEEPASGEPTSEAGDAPENGNDPGEAAWAAPRPDDPNLLAGNKLVLCQS